MQQKVYIIDNQNKSIEDFIELLQQNKIQVLVDIRKNPNSSFRPIFNQDVLEKYFSHLKIGYKFLGKELSTNTIEIRKTVNYQNGLYYIECGLEFNYKVALFSDGLNKILISDLERKGFEIVKLKIKKSVKERP